VPEKGKRRRGYYADPLWIEGKRDEGCVEDVLDRKTTTREALPMGGGKRRGVIRSCPAPQKKKNLVSLVGGGGKKQAAGTLSSPLSGKGGKKGKKTLWRFSNAIKRGPASSILGGGK